MAAAAWATGQPPSIRWHKSSRPCGSGERYGASEASLVSVLPEQLHTRLGGFIYGWTLSARSMGTTPRGWRRRSIEGMSASKARQVVHARGVEQPRDRVGPGLGVLLDRGGGELLEVRLTVTVTSARFRPCSPSSSSSRRSGAASAAGCRLNVCQPSPKAAARRSAASLSPPMWIGGCGCWTGLGP